MPTTVPGKSAEVAADIAFTGGPVYTVDAARSWSDAVAVRGGMIAAVGGAAVAPLIGPATEVVELAGRLLLPGFIDAHVHPVMGGVERAQCDLTGTSGAGECLDRIASYARRNPDRPWILGGGWSMDQFAGGTPSRHDLDAVVPDRPAYLVNRDHHGAWVNTRAIEAAGIGPGTPDPADGRIEREHDGSAQGTLHEGATMLVAALTPQATAAQYAAGLAEGQRYLHSLGVTGWQDAIVGPYLGHRDSLATYLAFATSGRLTARVAGALWWDRDRGEEQIADLIERREAGRVGRFAARTVKIMQDGICENFSAAMLDPYLDTHGRPAGRGHSFIEPAALARYVTRLDAAGFQVHFHAIGDRAVRESLDAVAAARAANGWSDHRHHIAHIQVIHPADIRRFRELGVAANMQPLWAAADAQMVELTMPFLGERRSGWQYPFASLRSTGAVLAAGSDWPVSSPDPLHGIHVAVNRTGRTPGDLPEPFLPRERLTLGDALAAYTAGGAWVCHLDHLTGTIETGKAADLVVLDRNPFDGEPGEIADTTVDMTFVQGSAVHAAGR